MRAVLFVFACLLSACSRAAPHMFVLHDGVRIKVENADVKEVRRFGSGFDSSGGYVEWITVLPTAGLPELKITGHQYGREATRRSAAATCKSGSSNLQPTMGVDLLRDFLGPAADASKPVYLLVPPTACHTTEETAADHLLFMVCQGEATEATCIRERPYRGVFVHYTLNGSLLARVEDIDKQVTEYLSGHIVVLEHQ